MPSTTSSWVVIVIYHLINIYFAFYIGETIIHAIREAEDSIPNKDKKIKKKKNIFTEDNGDEIIEAQDAALSRPVLILSALLPFLILSTIYFTILDHVHELLVSAIESSGKKVVAAYFISFFAGLASAKIFLHPQSEGNDFYKVRDSTLLQRRLNNVEIFYLSATLCIILFSYLDFDLKVNLIKGTITSFLIGNAFYLVFRQNIRFPNWVFKYFNHKNNKGNDVNF